MAITLKKYVALADMVTDVLGRAIAWLTLLIVLLTFAIVVLRYGFNLGWIAMQESVLYFHGLIFMLGAAYTLKEDAHVRVDIFYQYFSAKTKAIVNLFGTLCLLFPVCIFIGFVSVDFVTVSWRILESSSEAGGLPLVFISKSYLFLFVITVCFQGVTECCKNTLTILEQDK